MATNPFEAMADQTNPFMSLVEENPFTQLAVQREANQSGFMKEFLKAIPSTTLQMAEGMVGTLKSVAQIDPAVAKQYGAWAPSVDRPEGNPLVDSLEQMGENIESAKAKFSPTGTSFGAWAGQVLGQAVPYIAMTMATGGAAGLAGASAGTAAGIGSATAAGAAFFSEGEDAYDSAIESGATEEEAQLERYIVGGVNGIIEAVQIGNMLRFSKGQKVGVRNLIRLARQRSYGLLAAEGKKLTVAAVKSGIESGIEEMLQEGDAMLVPGILRGEGYEKKLDGSPDWLAIASRLAKAGAAGAFVGGVVGTGGAVTGFGEVARPSKEAIQASADRINSSNLSPVEKGRALEALNNLTEDSTEGLVPEDNIPDIQIAPEVQETLDTAKRVETALSELDIDVKAEKAAMSEERGKRFAEYEAILKAEPDPVVAEALAKQALTGDLKLNFTPLSETISRDDMTKLYSAVRSSTLMTGQKLHLFDMLDVVFGEGKLPQKSQMKAFDQLFGTTLSRTMDKKLLTSSDKIRRAAEDVLNIPRAMLASMDFSAAGRQGLLLFQMSPKNWAKATWAGYRAALNPQYSEFIDLEMRSNPMFSKFVGMGGHYAESGMGAVEGEEAYASRFINKIPGIAPSERAYRTTLNMLRVYNFQKIAKDWEGTGKTTKDFKKLASFINHATGRGDLPGFMKKYASEMNIAFFAPRMHFGIAQTWVDALYGDTSSTKSFFKGSPEARKIIAGTMVKALGSGLAVLGMAKLSGLDIEWDPRSADWGLIRIGDTRINFWGPHQTLMKAMLQLAMGKKKSTSTGMVYEKAHMEIMKDFLATKLNAGPALVNNLARGYNMFGERINPTIEGVGEAVLESVVPLVWQDIFEAYKFQGMSSAAIVAPLAIHGIGAMTYQQRESSKDTTLKNSYAQEYFGTDWQELGPDAQKAIRQVHPDVEQQEQRKKIEQMDYVSDVKFAEESRQSALRVSRTMSSSSVELMKSLDIPVPGVGRVLGTNWVLTMKRAKEYEKETAELLDIVVGRVKESPGFESLGPDAKRGVLQNAIKLVKENVKANIMKQANMKDIERREAMGGQSG